MRRLRSSTRGSRPPPSATAALLPARDRRLSASVSPLFLGLLLLLLVLVSPAPSQAAPAAPASKERRVLVVDTTRFADSPPVADGLVLPALQRLGVSASVSKIAEPALTALHDAMFNANRDGAAYDALYAQLKALPDGGVLVVPSRPRARPPLWLLRVLLGELAAKAPFAVSRDVRFYLQLAGVEEHGPQTVMNMRAFEDRLLSLAAQAAALRDGYMACGGDGGNGGKGATTATATADAALEALVLHGSASEGTATHAKALQSLSRAAEAAAADALARVSENEELIRANAHLLRACLHHVKPHAGLTNVSWRLDRQSGLPALFQSPYKPEQDRRRGSMSFAAARPTLQTLADPPLIPKKQLNGKRRWVAVAALEGTGHHNMDMVFKSGVAPSVVGGSQAVTDLVGRFWYSDRDLDALLKESKLKAVGAQLKAYMQKPDNAPGLPSRLVIMNTLLTASPAGMMSYPNYESETRAQHHPDPARLAALAESAGADLRVIVLLRSPVDVVYSTAIKRRFMAIERQIELLTHETMVLLEQLRVMDPRFYACFDMDDTSAGVCHVLAHHLAWPNGGNPEEDLCERFGSITQYAKAHHTDRTLPAQHTRMMIPFYHADAAVRDMCRRAHAIHEEDRAAARPPVA